MDIIEYFEQKRRMCRYYKGECCKCALGKNKLKTKLQCFKLENNDPNIAATAVKEWAKEHPLKTYKSVFLESFPNARLDRKGYPYLCITYICGEAVRPKDCGILDCNDCWNRPYKEIEEV